MPRTSSTPSRSTPSRSTPSKSVLPVAHPPSITHYTPSAPTLGQSMKEGFGLGAGSAIAQRVVSSVFGAPTINVATPTEKKIESPCEKERVAFETCMKFKSADDFCGNEQTGYTECIRLTR